MTQRFGDDLLPPEKFHSFGDWLSINADTPHDVFYTAFFAHSVDLTARAADVLGKPDEAKRLRELFGRIKSTFNQAFVLADGKVKGETQTGYVLALTFDLLDSPIREKAAGHLVADVEGRGFHLSTGFNGTKHLLHTLSRFGYTDVAYRLLHNDTFPSWGFTIRHGATSIWERWDGWTPEKGFQDPGMNSFAHYSFGAVYSWMAAHIGGIRRDTVGWKHLTLAPDLDPKLTHATVSYDGPRGRIETAWTRDGDTVRLRVRIPANSTATLVLPGSGEKFELGSGEYEYTVRP
jgi:alpha-L-rhamnosidase